MSAVNPSTTVVVCCYTEDRWDDIDAGITRLTQQTYSPSEILVVVDHNERLLQRARQHCDLWTESFSSEVRVIANTDQQGLSGARNTAINEAKSDIIAFLDDDALPALDWLELLIEPFADPTVLVSGGRSMPAWPNSVRPRWFPEEFDWVVGSTYKGMPTDTAPVRNVHGCSMAFRREVFDTIGGFTTEVGRIGKVPLGCEETELCIRLRAQEPGAQIIYVPRSLVHHRVSQDRVAPRYFIRRCLAEGTSKAQIGTLVGQSAATEDERGYVTKALPKGVADGVLASFRGDWHGLQRAGMIVAGLVLTTVGYARRMATDRFAAPKAGR